MTTKYQGSCHCGDVRFEVELDPDQCIVCDCSICRRKGGIINRVEADCFRLLTAMDQLTLYQFNKLIARHYFCSRCGIYTFHRPRTMPEKWAVNVRCLVDFDLESATITQVHGSELD